MRRRDFLKRSAAVAGAGWVGQRLLAQDFLEAARRLLESNLSFDLHMHPALFPVKGPVKSSNPRPYRGDAFFAERIQQMRDGRLSSGFFSLVTDAPVLGRTPQGGGQVRDWDPGQPWGEYKRQLRVLRELLEANDVAVATTVVEISRARAAGRVAAVIGCEGGDHLEGQPERIEEVYADGVRHIQLVHVAPNALGDIAGRDPVHGGLSAAGADIVREMNRFGMTVDVAHASEKTALEVAELTTAPIIHSHGLARHPELQFPLAMSRAHIGAVADTGGVIGAFGGGVNRDLDGYADNILRLAEVAGLEHVGLGSDLDGTGGRSVFDDYRQLPALCAALLQKGLSSADVAGIAGGNLARVLKAGERSR